MGPSTSNPIRVLLVGAGTMGLDCHRRTVLGNTRSQLVGLVRRTPRPTDDSTPVFSYADLTRALEITRPHLAIIATPHSLHYEQTKACLNRGVHVLVEKPLAFELVQVEELIALAEAKSLVLTLNLQRRFEGAAIYYRELLKQGRLGTIRFVHGLFVHRFATPSQQTANWRNDPTVAGRGILDDSAFHVVDMALHYANGGLNASTLSGTSMGRNGLVDSFACHFYTDNGAMVDVSGSYLCMSESVQEEFTVLGTEGSLFIRRFCPTWNTKPPEVTFKSATGECTVPVMTVYPSGRALVLEKLLQVLVGDAARSDLHTEARHVFDTHRVLLLLKSAAARLIGPS
jgi:predicted dehydrogenase